VAWTRDGIVVWSKPGAPSDQWFGSFRDVRVDARGKHMIALADDRVHVFEIEQGKIKRRSTNTGDSIDLDDSGMHFAVSQLGDRHVLVFPWDGKPREVKTELTATDSALRFQPGGGKHLLLGRAHRLVSIASQGKETLDDAYQCVYAGSSRLLCLF